MWLQNKWCSYANIYKITMAFSAEKKSIFWSKETDGVGLTEKLYIQLRNELAKDKILFHNYNY